MPDDCGELVCQWYDTERQVWSDSGCTSRTVRETEGGNEETTSVVCTCDHLTDFAVLVDNSNPQCAKPSIAYLILACLFGLMCTYALVLFGLLSFCSNTKQGWKVSVCVCV